MSDTGKPYDSSNPIPISPTPLVEKTCCEKTKEVFEFLKGFMPMNGAHLCSECNKKIN